MNTTNSRVFRTVDVIVAGAGPAGIAAALAAAREGARVLLIERWGRIGGAGVTSVVNPLMGGVRSPVVAEIIAAFEARNNSWEILDLVYYDLLEAAGVELLLHSWVVGPIMEGASIRGVQILCKEGILNLEAARVIDATADGDVAFGAGVPYEQGRERDGLLQPMTIMFRVGGVDKSRGLICLSERNAHDIEVPGGTWHEVCHEAEAAGILPKNVTTVRIYESQTSGERIVNATQVNYVDGTKVADITRAEIEGRRQALVVHQFMKERAPGYESCYISHMPAAVGVRDTRRFKGEYYMTLDDCIEGRTWHSAIVRRAFFPVDIHNPDGGGQADGADRHVKPYDIPYECLIPLEVYNLILAGRCISGSHEAHASYRVQRIMMAVGAAAGAAAAISIREHVTPRHLEVELVQKAIGVEIAEDARALAS